MPAVLRSVLPPLPGHQLSGPGSLSLLGGEGGGQGLLLQ